MAEGGPGLREHMKEVVVGTEFPSLLLHLRHHHHPVWSKVIGRTDSRFRIEDFSKDNSKAPYFELKGRKAKGGEEEKQLCSCHRLFSRSSSTGESLVFGSQQSACKCCSEFDKLKCKLEVA